MDQPGMGYAVCVSVSASVSCVSLSFSLLCALRPEQLDCIALHCIACH
jgi:hypothetical protein